jgi:hypothetical protein
MITAAFSHDMSRGPSLGSALFNSKSTQIHHRSKDCQNILEQQNNNLLSSSSLTRSNFSTNTTNTTNYRHRDFLNIVAPSISNHSHNNLQPPRYENSYIVQPGERQKFQPHKIQPLVEQVLEKHLENVAYEQNKCKELSKSLCEDIKSILKHVIYKRYKIVVNVSIFQNLNPTSFLVASRALWNTETDNCCTVNYKNSSLVAIAIVFAVYQE